MRGIERSVTGAMAAVLAVAIVAAPAQAAWHATHRVADVAWTGAAMTVDRDGNHWVAGRGKDGVFVVRENDGTWRTTRLTRDRTRSEGTVTDRGPAIAVDPVTGAVIVAWLHEDVIGTGGCTGAVRFRRFDGERWSRTRPIPTGRCAAQVELAVHGGWITAAVALEAFDDVRVEVVMGRPGAWTHQQFGGPPDPDDSVFPFAQAPDVTLGRDGRPHVTYLHGRWDGHQVTSSVRWVHRSSTPGRLANDLVTRLAPAPHVSSVDALAIVVDRTGRVAIAWSGSDGLFLARRSGGVWSVEMVGEARRGVAMAARRDGRLVIAGATGQHGLVVTAETATGWRVDTLDDHVVTRLCGIAIDGAGQVSVAWQRGWDSDPARVWLATSA